MSTGYAVLRVRLGVALAASVALSGMGMAYHAAHEFGWPALAAASSGFLPVLAVQVALLAAWWRARARPLRLALGGSGILLLVGGGISSVLPLPFLPFVPDQSGGHYASHVVLALCQVPLVALGFHRTNFLSATAPPPMRRARRRCGRAADGHPPGGGDLLMTMPCARHGPAR